MWIINVFILAPYEGGVWKVRVDLPDKYPFKSPSIGIKHLNSPYTLKTNKQTVDNLKTWGKNLHFFFLSGFMNKIFHPNIDEA